MTDLTNIAPALVGALTDLTNIAKAHEGGGGGKKYTYANLADLVADTRPALAEHGLVALQSIHAHGDGAACTVVLLHESGERMDFGPFPFPTKGLDAQSTGSWITYVRRYSLLAALGMGTEDDDGKSAQPAPRQQQRPQELPSGLSAKAAGDKVRETLTEITGLDGAELTNHAKQVWRDVGPKAIDGIVPDAEVERLVAAAKQHGNDLEAMAREELHA